MADMQKKDHADEPVYLRNNVFLSMCVWKWGVKGRRERWSVYSPLLLYWYIDCKFGFWIRIGEVQMRYMSWIYLRSYFSLTVFMTFAYWETAAGLSGSMVIFSFRSTPMAVSNFFLTSRKMFFNISTYKR